MRLLTIFLSIALLGNATAQTFGLYTYSVNADNASVTITDYPTNEIGLLCFSIFAEDDKSKPAPAPTVIVEKDAPQLVEVFSLNNVDKFIGKFIEHESRVFGITVTSSGTVYFNLGGKFPSQLMNLVIFKSSRNNVDKLPQAGDTISYAGVVEVYKGKPRIVIESGAQLTLIQRR